MPELADIDTVMKVAGNFGIPAVILAAIGYAIRKTAQFMAPQVTSLILSHNALVDSLKSTSEAQTSLLQNQSATLATHTDKLDSHGRKLDEHGKLLEDIRWRVKGPKSDPPPPPGK